MGACIAHDFHPATDGGRVADLEHGSVFGLISDGQRLPAGCRTPSNGHDTIDHEPDALPWHALVEFGLFIGHLPATADSIEHKATPPLTPYAPRAPPIS